MKLSIIIPVYNGEKYLRECLDSIVAQKFRDYECIVVNDGSTDNSKNIINEYVEKYSNFKIVNQANSGVSIARNKGIELSQGEYITFVDCDDYIEMDSYEQIFEEIKQYTPDVICFGINQIDSCGEIIAKLPFKHIDIVSDFIDYSIYMHSPFNKIFKKSHLKKYSILFNSQLCVLEDMEFSFRSICMANKVFFSQNTYYNYRINPHSVVGKGVTERHIRDYKLASELIENFCRENNVESEYQDYIEYRKMYYYMSWLCNVNFFSPQKYRTENQEKLYWKYGGNWWYKIISYFANKGCFVPAYAFFYLKKLIK